MSLSISRHTFLSVARSLLVGFGVVAMLAAGCGSSGGESASSTTTDTETTDTETTDSSGSEGAESDDSGGSKSDEAYADAENPLAAYLGFDMDNPDAWIEQERTMEQKVQECMRAQGFDYEISNSSNMVSFTDRSDMSDEDYAAAHGYGIVEPMLEFSAAQEDGDALDPNMTMLDGMTDTERTAWETAAYGPPLSESEFEDESAMMQMEPQGCYGEASAEVYGDFAVFEQLTPAFEAMDAQIKSDPRMVEINNKWTACMSEAGYNFESQDDAFMSISDQIDEIMETQFTIDATSGEEVGAVDGGADDGEAPEAMTDDGGQSQLADISPQLEELKVEEIAVATADAKCLGDDREEMNEISREYQLKFIEENKTVLDQANS